MFQPGRRVSPAACAVLVLIAAAYGIRFVPLRSPEPGTAWYITGLLRSGIYIGLFAAWGVSARGRVLQPQVRRYLSAISASLVFWMAVRSAKYYVFRDPQLCRLLWYAYYIPQALIPLMLVLIACSLGKPEAYRLPKWTNALYAAAAILAGLILTNDLHQLAFGFPQGPAHYENGEYTHGAVYFLAVGWIALCVLATLVMLYGKCRIPGGKRRIWRPCVPVLLLAVYGAAYLLTPSLLTLIRCGDLTVVSGLMCVAMLESCIRCGLIRSNTGYDELFRASLIHAILVDDDGRIVLASDGAPALSGEIMARAAQSPVLLDGNLRLSGAPIRGGRVLWTEDVSGITALLEELAEKQEDLKEETALLRENYNTELHIRQLMEKNRLYDEIHRRTAPQILQMSRLIDHLKASRDEAEKKRLLQKLVVIGVYLKRRSNLVFLGEQSGTLPVQELRLCLEETMDNLRLSGALCGCYVAMTHDLDTETAAALYDFAGQVIVAACDTLRSLLIRVFETADDTAVSLELRCDADLSALADLADRRVSVSCDEDGTVCLVLRIPKGGDAE